MTVDIYFPCLPEYLSRADMHYDYNNNDFHIFSMLMHFEFKLHMIKSWRPLGFFSVHNQTKSHPQHCPPSPRPSSCNFLPLTHGSIKANDNSSFKKSFHFVPHVVIALAQSSQFHLKLALKPSWNLEKYNLTDPNFLWVCQQWVILPLIKARQAQAVPSPVDSLLLPCPMENGAWWDF